MIDTFDVEWNWGTGSYIMYDNAGQVEIQFEKGYEWGYICGLVVNPARRKEGIATALMQKCEEVAKEHGFDELQLKVEKERKWQFEWYKRLGYKVTITDDSFYYMRKIMAR